MDKRLIVGAREGTFKAGSQYKKGLILSVLRTSTEVSGTCSEDVKIAEDNPLYGGLLKQSNGTLQYFNNRYIDVKYSNTGAIDMLNLSDKITAVDFGLIDGKSLVIGVKMSSWHDKSMTKHNALVLYTVQNSVRCTGIMTVPVYIEDGNALYDTLMTECDGDISYFVNSYISVDNNSKGYLESVKVLESIAKPIDFKLVA